ncbi:MAG: hypothetical protein JWM10_3718 [Myxococcaceae bacterium]|nr:hypothetical protein [Myxococcaceae bacterium]
MTNTAAIDNDPVCDGCWYARERSRDTGDTVECVCGATYPTPARVALVPAAPTVEQVARRPSRPSVVPDARISVVHDPQPSSAPRFTRPTFSDDHVARLLRCLEELQVDVGDDRAGGVSWAPPSPVAAQRYDRVVVQTSAQVPTTPNLAALLGVVDDTRPTVGWTICDRACGDVTIESVLRWLREHGSRAKLGEGGQTARAEVTRIYETVGYLYASEKARARFDADPKVKAEAAPVRGRELVQQAMAAWWG